MLLYYTANEQSVNWWAHETLQGAKTIKKNTNSIPNKSQTHRAKQYEVTSFLSTDCELSTETCSKNFYSLGPRTPFRRHSQSLTSMSPTGKHVPRIDPCGAERFIPEQEQLKKTRSGRLRKNRIGEGQKKRAARKARLYSTTIDIMYTVRKMKWSWAGNINRLKDNRWTSRVTTWIPYNIIYNITLFRP